MWYLDTNLRSILSTNISLAQRIQNCHNKIYDFFAICLFIDACKFLSSFTLLCVFVHVQKNRKASQKRSPEKKKVPFRMIVKTGMIEKIELLHSQKKVWLHATMRNIDS